METSKTTKTRNKSSLIGNQTGNRFDTAQRTGTGDLGPGAYERSDGFGKSGKGLGFGKPKPEKKVVDNRDYGYQGEKSYTQARQSTKSITLSKETPARGIQTRKGDSLGPGSYNVSKEFGKDVKGVGFGKPKPEKKVVDNRDYGYQGEKSHTQIRQSSKTTLITKEQTARGQSARAGDPIGPGSYQV